MKTRLTKLFVEFFESEQASGIILILCTVAAIALVNSPAGVAYTEFLHTTVGFEAGGIALKGSVEYWINDGLMAIFFLMIGLEIERELYSGELSNLKNAALPVVAAVGGMVTPALLHFAFNHGSATQAGVGIPMATDIAFALGVLALLGNRVPPALKIFLAALAIIDDLGAIVVIALFYQGNFSLLYFGLAVAVFAGLLLLNRLGVRRLWLYLIPGLFMWYFMLKSGVHATIAGVLLAFAIPFVRGGEKSPSHTLQHALHKPVAFVIMPLFALANAGINLHGNWLAGLVAPNSVGIMAGLFCGKPLGIVLFSAVAIKLGAAQLPRDVSWRQIIGAGFLGGIGFTMSIFITLLAFVAPDIVQSSKISIVVGSLASGIVGYWMLRRAYKKSAVS
jgi:NhaA family Na+:H+ antiporter